MPILAREEEGKLQPIPRAVLEAAAAAATTAAARAPGNFTGVETAVDPMGREVYIACLNDAEGVEHRFSFNFATDWGAAAAHDVMLRRLRNNAPSGSVRPDARENFPGDMPWEELVGNLLAGASEAHLNNSDVDAMRKTDAEGGGRKKRRRGGGGGELQLVGLGDKKQRRSSKEPCRFIIGNRVYDSELAGTYVSSIILLPVKHSVDYCDHHRSTRFFAEGTKMRTRIESKNK